MTFLKKGLSSDSLGRLLSIQFSNGITTRRNKGQSSYIGVCGCRLSALPKVNKKATLLSPY